MELTVPFSSYKYLRLVAIIAGLLGAAQSLAWLGMSIFAILTFYCQISFAGVTPTYGNILQLTFTRMYFIGDCIPAAWPQLDMTIIADLDLMTPQNVNIGMWVVASLSLLWLFSSVSLLISVKKSNIRQLNVFLYIWIFIAFAVAMTDLVLFIFFILDYNTILRHSFNYNLSVPVPSTYSILITAQNSAGMMASLAMRGYFLWLLNIIFVVYLFTQTFRVSDYNRMNEIKANEQVNEGFEADNEVHGNPTSKNQHIRAYEHTPHLPWYNYLTTDIPRVQTPQPSHPNAAPFKRSKSTSNLDESFQKRMSAAATSQPNQAVNRHSGYEPRPQLRSALRNSRY